MAVNKFFLLADKINQKIEPIDLKIIQIFMILWMKMEKYWKLLCDWTQKKTENNFFFGGAIWQWHVCVLSIILLK